jgi:hypothetical protein
MNCETIHLDSPLARHLHQLRCPECRAARAADRGLRRGIEHLRAEPAPTAGLARTLAAVGAVPVAPAQRRNSRKRAALRRWLMPTGMVTTVTAAGVAGWAYYIDLAPGIAVPAPVMPAHNAFDVFRAAHTAETNPKDVDEAVSGKTHKVTRRWATPFAVAGTGQPGRNAGSPGGGLPAGVSRTYPSTIEVTQPWTLAEKAALVRKNREALHLLREGLELAYWTPPLRSPSAALPYLSEDRSLVRLLELEAQVREAQGDVAGAVNSRLDAIELGSKLTCGSTIIGRLVGISCETIGRKHLWTQVNRLDAQQAREAALRMQRNIRFRRPFATTLEEEEWAGVATIETIISDQRWRLNMGELAGGTNENSNSLAKWQSNLWGYFMLLPYSRRRIVLNYMTMMEAETNASRGGYDERTEEANQKKLEALQEQQDPITKLLFPIFIHAHFLDAAGCETQDLLLMTTLALRAYEQEHHRYPDTLSELTPRYLASVPDDPFGHGRPLRYRHGTTDDPASSHQVFTYSVGPDGQDDGGKPIDNLVRYPNSNAAKEEMRREIWPGSKGDIIAGLNVSAGQ